MRRAREKVSADLFAGAPGSGPGAQPLAPGPDVQRRLELEAASRTRP